MVFSSVVFLFIFLPVIFILYTVIPSIRVKNILLIAASILFYAYGEHYAVFLMLAMIVINYIFGRLIAGTEKGKAFMITAVTVDIGILAVVKYLDFIISLINQLLKTDIPLTEIKLPIGISFFTFQALSYVIDVYKDKKLVQKNLFDFALYISFFPQLVAGPIIKYYDIAMQINNRQQSAEKIYDGLKRFIIGLSKKLLIANVMGNTADAVFALQSSDVSLPVAWIGAVSYVFQIYFDFSGYSDMAIGLGAMFGFSFKENFNYPYIAESMQDFWRRWHISVSTWFKEYLYFPLGGNRKGKFRTNINKIIVFFFTGLWHGANMTFVVWGLIHGTFLMLEQYGIIPLNKIKFKAVKHIYTMIVVAVTFVIFRADTLSQGVFIIKQMFTGFDISAVSFGIFVNQLTPIYIAAFVLAIVFSTPVVPKLEKYVSEKGIAAYEPICMAVTFVLFLICVVNLSSATYNPFIYFKF